jgi:hypothetical protein
VRHQVVVQPGDRAQRHDLHPQKPSTSGSSRQLTAQYPPPCCTQWSLQLNFEYEAGYVAPVWPSVEGQQQLQTHLDIAVNDLASTVVWAQQAGAMLAAFQPQEDVRVMLDPVVVLAA